MDELLTRHGAEACIGCGRCTYTCPAARRYEFSPRDMVERLAAGLPVEAGLWACTACRACSAQCSAGVDVPGLVRDLRRRSNEGPLPAHHDVLGKVRRLSSDPALRPRTHRWLSPGLRTDPASPVLLFVGCLPYFDPVFRGFRPDLLDIPRAAVRLLNAAGIAPRLLEAERCCGHDAHWMGEDEVFERLAGLNMAAVEEAGVEEVVTVCPECRSAWKDLYPRRVGGRLKVRHVGEVAAAALADGRLELAQGDEVLTYQDPCWLGREGVVEEPRAALRAVGRLAEMPRHGEAAACCGVASWTNCDRTAKGVQLDRLREAGATGAGTLVTACPKCLVHLSCALAHHPDAAPPLLIEDLSVVLASRLKAK